MILRIYTSKDAGQAKTYYVQKLSKEAYYAENQEFSGYWGGAAASHFGLSGRVDETAFNRFCDNLHPVTGEKLTQRMKENRRVGEDFNFNCPKSVSLAYAYTKDERIIQAFRQAVRDTMEEMETLVSTRVRKDGVKDSTRITGKWVYGEFVHLTARPVGGIPDPHLHIHCFVPNITLDPVEKRWKAMETRKIHDHANDFDAAVMRRLMSNLKELGLGLEMTKDAFEIAGISRELIEDFSRRTKQINADAERRGITDAKEKAGLAALTRESKAKTLLIPELEEYWWGGLPPEHRNALEVVKTLLQRSRAEELSQQMVPEMTGVQFVTGQVGVSSLTLGTKRQSGHNAGHRAKRESVNKRTRPKERVVRDVEANDDDRKAVAAAALHLFERASVVTELDLAGEAARNWRYGDATWDGIKKALQDMDFLRKEINGEIHLTTREIWEEEQRIIASCREGMSQFEPMNATWKIEDERLNEQQRNAVAHVVNSTDFIVGIAGKAGTGKTTLMSEAKRAIEAGYIRCLVFAPTSKAARDVLRSEGFRDAETVARLLQNEVFQENARGAVWWIDEAGLISTRQMDRLVALAKRLDARLILGGDIGQHHAVERGQAFKLLENQGGMKVAQVDEIMRQRGDYKRFVEQAAKHDHDSAFETLHKMESLTEVPTMDIANIAAEKFLKYLKRGETVQATCPTNKECDRVTEAIRAKLKAEKIIKNGIEWSVLKDEHWSEAEKRDYHRYKKGQIIQINRHVKKFSLGEKIEVIDVREGVVRVRTKTFAHNHIKALPLAEAASFGIYRQETIEICEGETIRATCNGRNAEGHLLDNGTEYKVDYISRDGKLVLENGWRVDKTFKHLDYSWCPTSHGMQGKTVDRVIVVQSAMATAAADANQFYVSTSRGRKGIEVITDDVEKLKENVSRVRSRMMASEMDQGVEREVEVAEEQVRTSDLLGMQKENSAIEMEAVEKSHHYEQELSERLGRWKAEEIERIRREREEMEMDRGQEMVMGM